MSAHKKEPKFAVYLGCGLYVGGVVDATPPDQNFLLINGAPDGQALAIALVGQAATYCRSAAIRVCHVARRSGVGAWLIHHPAHSA